jgi:Family of unknown function (DUF6886)
MPDSPEKARLFRQRLYHVSDEPRVTVFDPRPAPSGPDIGIVVWAVSESHLVNYLLPRECPRVTFSASKSTTEADRQRFGVTDYHRVVIIERGWWDRVNASTLYFYELPPQTFRLHDEDAGYWISRESVRPLNVMPVGQLRAAIQARGAELRVVDRLWEVHDNVAASTLSFSIIRMRNATK